jgi:hypothetical protein
MIQNHYTFSKLPCSHWFPWFQLFKICGVLTKLVSVRCWMRIKLALARADNEGLNHCAPGISWSVGY